VSESGLAFQIRRCREAISQHLAARNASYWVREVYLHESWVTYLEGRLQWLQQR
jgi:hypothetical protein